MIELTERNLQSHLDDQANGGDSGLPDRLFLFVYTPFCGTCAAARKMLDILKVMRPELPLYAANVNFLPKLVQAWEISSVPCLLRLRGKEPAVRLYAMQSIDHLFRFLISETPDS